jgi:putative MFS transporter
MYIGAGITFVGFLACLAWAEETRNRSLEETGAIGVVPASPPPAPAFTGGNKNTAER